MVGKKTVVVAALAASLGVPAGLAGAQFLRGDANRDGRVDLGDAVSILVCSYLIGPISCSMDGCPDAADADDNGKIEVTDPIVILSVLFLGYDFPFPSPFPYCGDDPTEDGLDCPSEGGTCPPAPQGGLVVSSGCKAHEGGGGAAAEECIEWSFSGNVLVLRHRNGDFNCCADIGGAVTIDGSTIAVLETESFESFACPCMCLYELVFEVRDLPPGSYLIRIDTPEVEGEPIPVDLAREPAGSVCAPREGYPWTVE